ADNPSAALSDLGECEVKHGQRLHLFNLHSEKLGNPQIPSKLHSAAPDEPRAQPLRAGTPQSARVVLLYKRSAQPDEELLKLLEMELLAHGCSVFVDRHLTIG